jgi:hypothetical protein
VRRADHRESRHRVDQHLRADFVRDRVRRRHHGLAGTTASSLQAPDAGKKATLRARIDLGADLGHDAGAFKSGYPPNGGDCWRRSERWRAHDTEKVAGTDPREGYADANLIWPERHGGAVFDPKHSRRVSEFVVGDSSHVNLQRLGTGRQMSPVRFDNTRRIRVHKAANAHFPDPGGARPRARLTKVKVNIRTKA